MSRVKKYFRSQTFTSLPLKGAHNMKLPLFYRQRTQSEKRKDADEAHIPNMISGRKPIGPAVDPKAFSRPRASTVGETFQKFLNTRRRSGGRTPRGGGGTKTSSPGSPGDSLTGSLAALWRPGDQPTDHVCIVVVGADGTGKSTLIERLVEAWASFASGASTSDVIDRLITFVHGGGTRCLRFIEVNSDRDDLWDTIEGNAYIVLYAVNDDASFHRAEELLGLLCSPSSQHADKPIWLVGTWLDSICRAVTVQDAKSLSKKFDVQLFEVTSNPSELSSKKQREQMLKLMKDIVVSFSAKDYVNCINKLTLDDFPKLNQPLRKISRSCDNLHTVRTHRI